MRDVSASYDSENVILKNISMNVKRGTNYAIVGASGSGKSTLIRHVNRLIDPTDGVIRIGKEDVLVRKVPREFRHYVTSLVVDIQRVHARFTVDGRDDLLVGVFYTHLKVHSILSYLCALIPRAHIIFFFLICLVSLFQFYVTDRFRYFLIHQFHL